MISDQALLFALLAGILGMLLWGRIRYDVVAAAGLMIAVILGLVPEDRAFSGFSNHAVLIIAFVLIASRAFENSGGLTALTRKLTEKQFTIGAHVAVTGSLAAALSAIINNVAALAILMPLDVQAARKAGRPPGSTLMPLSFATILGGMVTLIGTPPNIIVSGIRAERLGEPYQMFDFTPVGIVVACAGLLFVAAVGWRLVPRRADNHSELTSKSSFTAELRVPEDSKANGRVLADFDHEAEEADVIVLGFIRSGKRYSSSGRYMTLKAGDFVAVEGSTDGIAGFIKATGLQEEEEKEKSEAPAVEKEKKSDTKSDPAAAVEKEEEIEAPEIVEAVVRAESFLAGRAAAAMALRTRFGISLLGIARSGVIARAGIHRQSIESGDVLLLTGRGAKSAATLDLLGLIPVTRTSVAPYRIWKIALTVGLFAAAIAVATAGLMSFTIAVGIVVVAYVVSGLVPPRELYQQVEWPVIVMLACLLPISAAFDDVGGTALIAGAIADMTRDYSPVIALIAIMVVSMTLSDVLNTVATIVITAPIGIDLALRLGVNPDTFLMGAAIASSCAFLTPIGHKNNTMIMGPGGFRFSDYWRMGLPLEIVVLSVSVPMLLLVWPL